MNKERLLKLAEHLESGKLGHDKFDFTQFHSVTKSGTRGCAIGELPFLFPDQWKFEKMQEWCVNSSPYLRDHGLYGGAYIHAEEFFDLTYEECASLFATNYFFSTDFPRPLLPGMKELCNKPSKQKVAANIRAFVAAKESL